MITYEMIEKLENCKDEDILAMLGELRSIAKEAKEVEQLIKSTWMFESGQEEILVWQDTSKGLEEYLTYDMKWKKKFSSCGSTIVDCSAAEIFEYFQAEFLFRNDCGCVREDADEIAKKAGICTSFRKFVKRTEEKRASMSA